MNEDARITEIRLRNETIVAETEKIRAESLKIKATEDSQAEIHFWWSSCVVLVVLIACGGFFSTYWSTGYLEKLKYQNNPLRMCLTSAPSVNNNSSSEKYTFLIEERRKIIEECNNKYGGGSKE